MKKSAFGIFLATLSLLLGLVGFFLDLVGKLPPEFQLPGWFLTAVTIFGLLVAGLGWQDELGEGKKAIIDKLVAFFSKPYRKLLWTALLAAAQKLSTLPDLPGGLETVVSFVLALSALVPLTGGYVEFRVKKFAHTRAL